MKSKQMVFELLNHFSSKQANKQMVFFIIKPFSSKQVSKQMVLNCKTIFQRASKQASKQKENLRKQAFPSSKQANRSEVFLTCTVVLGSHTCIVVLPGRQT